MADVVEHGSGVARTEPLLSRNWSLLALRGACVTTFGLLSWAFRDAEPGLLARVLFVLTAEVGVLSIAAATGARHRSERPWALWVEGASSCVIAIAFLGSRSPDAGSVARLASAWVAIVGLLEGAIACEVRRHRRTCGLLVAFALASDVAAVALFVLAGAPSGVVVWPLGAWACLFGASALSLAAAVRAEAASGHLVVRPVARRASLASVAPRSGSTT